MTHETAPLADGLHLLDCLDGLTRLPAASVDLVFADLPYGVTNNAWDRPIPLAPLWVALKHVCKPATPLVFTAMQPFASELVLSNRAWFRFDMVWVKNKPRGFLNAKRQPLRTHETILVFYQREPRYQPQFTAGHAPVHSYTKRTSDGTNYGRTKLGASGGGSTQRYPTSILPIPVVNEGDPGRIHTTQKPEDLPAWFIKTYTMPGDLVVDPTAGSGSTLAAAWRLGRRAVGFESDPKIFAAARAALADAMPHEAR